MGPGSNPTIQFSMPVFYQKDFPDGSKLLVFKHVYFATDGSAYYVSNPGSIIYSWATILVRGLINDYGHFIDSVQVIKEQRNSALVAISIDHNHSSAPSASVVPRFSLNTGSAALLVSHKNIIGVHSKLDAPVGPNTIVPGWWTSNNEYHDFWAFEIMA